MTKQQIPDLVRRWWADQLERMNASRRAVAIAGVRDFTPADWEAFFALHRTYRIAERTREELEELALEEQRVLKGMPPVKAFGHSYSAPWCLGVRVAAARRLWGDEDDLIGRTVAVPLDQVVLPRS